jgi:hypothetical protein
VQADAAGNYVIQAQSLGDGYYEGSAGFGTVYDSGSLGPFGFSDSSIDFHASVPFVVFATDSG